MEVPFFDLKQPRASLLATQWGLVSQYAFDQDAPILEVDLPTLELHCLFGHEIVRGTIIGLGQKSLTWRLSEDDAAHHPLLGNRNLWATYGEVALGHSLTEVRLTAHGIARLGYTNRLNPHKARMISEPQFRLWLRSSFAKSAFYSVWSRQHHAAERFPDLFTRDFEYVDGPPVEDTFSFSDMLSEIRLALDRAQALQQAISRSAPDEIVTSEREALLAAKYGPQLYERRVAP